MNLSPSLVSHPLFPLAAHLSTLPVGQHPLLNPSVKRLYPANVQANINQISRIPQLAAVATGQTATQPGAVSSIPSVQAPSGASDPSTSAVGDQMSGNGQWNPSFFRRIPTRRHLMCGMASLALGGNSSGTANFKPQTAFKGNHLIFPSNLTQGTVSNMLVGAYPQFAAQGAEDFAEFREDSTGGMWDLDPCDPGVVISATVTTVAAQTIVGCIVGEAYDQRAYPLLRSPLKRVGIPSTAVGAGATVTISVLPQVRFKARKIALTLSNVTGLIINSWLVGINPVFVSGDPVPAVALSEFAQELWLDLDEAHAGNVISFSVTNPTGAGLTFSGGLLGDVNPDDLSKMGYR